MNDLAILIVEDEPEVRDALIRDVAPFESQFLIEAAEDRERPWVTAWGSLGRCSRRRRVLES